MTATSTSLYDSEGMDMKAVARRAIASLLAPLFEDYRRRPLSFIEAGFYLPLVGPLLARCGMALRIAVVMPAQAVHDALGEVEFYCGKEACEVAFAELLSETGRFVQVDGEPSYVVPVREWNGGGASGTHGNGSAGRLDFEVGKLKCPLREYDCGDGRCQTHHADCHYSGECWHGSQSTKDGSGPDALAVLRRIFGL